jgi:ADP-heptose:LPS heptosyltransferase
VSSAPESSDSESKPPPPKGAGEGQKPAAPKPRAGEPLVNPATGLPQGKQVDFDFGAFQVPPPARDPHAPGAEAPGKKDESKPPTEAFDFGRLEVDERRSTTYHTPTPPAMRPPTGRPPGTTATPAPPTGRKPTVGTPTPRGSQPQVRPAPPASGGRTEYPTDIVARAAGVFDPTSEDEPDPDANVPLELQEIPPPKPPAPRAPTAGTPTPRGITPPTAREAALGIATPRPVASPPARTPTVGSPTPRGISPPAARCPTVGSPTPRGAAPTAPIAPEEAPLELKGDSTPPKPRTAPPPPPPPEPEPAPLPPPTSVTEIMRRSISFERILIIRLSALGDCIHALPAFASLRQAFPRSKIAWAIEDRCASLLEELPGLDQVIVFPRRDLKNVPLRPWLWPGGLATLLRTKRALRAFRPTVAFDFQGNFKSGLHTWLSGAPARIGIESPREGAERFYTHHVRLTPTQHRVERPLELLRAAGVPVAAARVSPPVQNRDLAAVEGWLRYSNVRRPVLFHAGTSDFGAIKRWPLENWSRLAELLSRDGQRTVVFVWGPGEKEMAEAAVAGMKSGRGLAGPDTPRVSTLAALIKKSDLFVGSDSGPLHLAAMMNAPVVGLYGPKDPAVYGPWCERHVVIWKGLVCSPCTRRECEFNDCMGLITPDEVAKASEGLLRRIGSPSAIREEEGAKESIWARSDEGAGWSLKNEE